MRILYGVQGTGNGHISRCRSVAEALARKGVEVDYLLSGRPANGYFDMQAFGHYRAVPGLTFASRDGELALWQTLRQNQPRRFWQDLTTLELEGYDRIISDFEPVTAWAARRRGLKSIGISHQAAFRYAIPRKGEDIASRLVMRHYAPVDQAIGLHWFHFWFWLLRCCTQLLCRSKSAQMDANSRHSRLSIDFHIVAFRSCSPGPSYRLVLLFRLSPTGEAGLSAAFQAPLLSLYSYFTGYLGLHHVGGQPLANLHEHSHLSTSL